MSDRSYYLCEFRLNKKGHFVVWFSNERDGLLLDHCGKIAAFGTPSMAITYAKENGIHINHENVPIYDFDVISAWCLQPHPRQIECELFLNTWNMFSDISASIGQKSIFASADKGLAEIYDNLFYGNNLPAVTPVGMAYEPEWSKADADKMAGLFRAGLQDLNGLMPA